MKKIIAKRAPAAIGPYSHAVLHNNIAYLSGQIALDPQSMELVATSIKVQTEQVITNIEAVLTEMGAGLENIIKTTVFLSSMNDFSDMNSVYEKRFGSHKPARSTIEVARLPKSALVEIECIAAIE